MDPSGEKTKMEFLDCGDQGIKAMRIYQRKEFTILQQSKGFIQRLFQNEWKEKGNDLKGSLITPNILNYVKIFTAVTLLTPLCKKIQI